MPDVTTMHSKLIHAFNGCVPKPSNNTNSSIIKLPKTWRCDHTHACHVITQIIHIIIINLVMLILRIKITRYFL